MEQGEQELRIPRHVAVILDGNGRWAKAHHLPRKMGHKAGCENLEQIVEDAARLGIEYFTIYGFSTENWKRSAEEVGALMQLFRYYIGRLRDVAMANDVRVRMIGERSRFDQDLIEGLNMLEDVTKNNRGMTFVLALNYGSRDEITRGMRRLARDAAEGTLDPNAVTEETIASYLDTAGMPDPDLMIRTSGEQRLSNYLLWQLAYAELYFTDVYWPDFHREDLIAAIRAYNQRDRRFGGR
ncbi:MAG: isoprenyl transferase [Lachnospiraceae bacterium]|nr:isoprenyl transferase [Lachnospiraceae bacterium]